MEAKPILPRSVQAYVREIGVSAFDNLAGKPQNAGGLQSLLDNWNARSADEKNHFVDQLAVSILEVAAETAIVPIGIKKGKKAAKTAEKFIKRRAKALKKNAKPSNDDANDGKSKKKKKQKK